MTIGDYNLLIRIRDQRDALTTVGKQIADYILEDPEAVLHMPIKTLSKHSNSSDAAVIRFCKSMGFSGYRDLVVHLSASISAKGEESHEQYTDIQAGDSLTSIVKNISYSNRQSIDDTISILDLSQLQQAVEVLHGARKIIFCGLGASGLVAMDAEQKFLRIGKNCHSYVDGHSQLVAAALMQKSDVAVLISNSGETRDVLDTHEVVCGTGALSVAITRNQKSRLRNAADIVLGISTPEINIRSGAMGSRIAMLNLIDVLYAGVASKEYDTVMPFLSKTRKAVEKKRL